MKYVVISDRPQEVGGFNAMGVEAHLSSAEEAPALFLETLRKGRTGAILLSPGVYDSCIDLIEEHNRKTILPVVVKLAE